MRATKALGTILVLVGARAVGAATTVGLAIFVARAFGIHFSGTFYFLISTVAVIGILTRLGAEEYLTAHATPEVRSGVRGTAPHLAAVLVAVTVTTTASGVLLLATTAAAPGLADRLLGALSSPWLLLAAVIGLNAIWTLSGFCRAIGRATTSILLETVLMSAWLGGLLAFWAWRSATPSIDAVALALGALAPVLLIPTLVLLRSGIRPGLRVAAAREAMVGLVRFASVTITNSIIAWIPILVLGLFGRIADVAVYNASFRMAMLIGAFGVMVKSAVIAARIHADGESVPDVGRDLRQSGAITLGFVVVSLLVTWQGDLLAAAFGDGFEEMQSILLLMLLAQSVNIGGYLIETKIVLTRNTRMLAANALLTLAVAVVSAPVLVATHGLDGAAWSFALTILASRTHLAATYATSAGRAAAAAGERAGVE